MMRWFPQGYACTYNPKRLSYVFRDSQVTFITGTFLPRPMKLSLSVIKDHLLPFALDGDVQGFIYDCRTAWSTRTRRLYFPWQRAR